MTAILYLIPISLFLGLIALAGFAWTVRSNQYEDLEGEKYRILEENQAPADVDAAHSNRRDP